MLGRGKVLILLFVSGLFCSGCVHTQLRYDTVHQAKTLNTIYEQQVLDNLAMFCQNPDALPFFAVPTTGGSRVTDQGSVSAGAPLNPFFTTIGLRGSRTHGGDWALETVSDPKRLTRMRCAYQRAVGRIDDTCIKCCDLEKAWKGDQCLDCDGPCSFGPGWYCCGSKKMIPNPCRLVGHYCGTYVYVLPEGRDQFTRLVLAIMNYAVNEPAPALEPRMKTVVRNFYKGNTELLERTETTNEPVLNEAKNKILRNNPNTTLENYYWPAPPSRPRSSPLHRLREDEILRRSIRRS